LDVELEASAETFSQFSQSFQVMLFDAGLRPICQASLVHVSSTIFRASFRFLDSFQGPFVAVLLPPSGVSLESAVAVSVEVRASVHVQTHVAVSSVREVSRTSSEVRLDVRASGEALVVERSSSGQIVAQRTAPVGLIERVAPHKTLAE